MQRTAQCFACLCAFALLTGCKQKEKEMKTDPYGGSSVAYNDPYAGGTSAGSGSATAGDPYAYSDSASAAPTKSAVHVVSKGETLYSLARMYYNDQAKWKDIYEANRHVIANPNQIRVGQELVIP